MIDTDVIVLATPTYFYGMSAQLKALIVKNTKFIEEAYNLGRSVK